MVTLSIANHKGGCGKTATAHALGDVLSRRRRVLLVDADPQGSLTGACGLADDVTPNLSDVLEGRVFTSAAIRRLSDTLAILPATVQLSDVELAMAGRHGRESMLRKAIERVTGFDLVIVDCGPGISLLALNALVASQAVIVPTQPQAQDLRALSLFLRTIDAVKADLNPGLQLVGVLPTFFNRQLTHHMAALAEIRANGLHVLYPIGRSVRIAEASAAMQAITTWAPDNLQAKAYEQLGKEIERWLKRNPA